MGGNVCFLYDSSKGMEAEFLVLLDLLKFLDTF